MAEPTEHLVIPYSRFLEYQQRRRASGGDAMKLEGPNINNDAPKLPDQPPAPDSTAWRTL